jgi:hypothetical protein
LATGIAFLPVFINMNFAGARSAVDFHAFV